MPHRTTRTEHRRSIGLALRVAICFALAAGQISDREAAYGLEPAGATACGHSERQFSCVRYLRNYDGDTITVEIPMVHPLLGREISVRIAGLDTPEMKANLPCERSLAIQARDVIESELSKAKVINLRNVSRDKYFRLLAEVHADGRNLGELLLKLGLARRYDGGRKSMEPWCD